MALPLDKTYTELSNQRILIIKQSSLGDVVHTLPLVHCLKRCYPGTSFGWIVEAGLQDLIAHDSAVDQVYPIHIPSTSEPGAPRGVYWQALRATVATLSNLRKKFRTLPYDLVLDLHASFRSGLLAMINPGGKRYGFAHARELNTYFQHVLIDNPEQLEHAVDKNLLFCREFGCTPEPADFYIEPGTAAEQAAQHFIEENDIDPERKLLYLSPTARWDSKFWIQKRWAALADACILSGHQVVFGGSGADLAYIEGITRQMDQQAVVGAGKLQLATSVALLQKADLYVGLDTGPMHIAAMVNTPVVALFGPTHPERVGPYGVPHRIVQAGDVDCLCCRMRHCADKRCMQQITVEQVSTEIEHVLEEEPKAPHAG